MARKETITKEMILEGAFQIMKSNGIQKVSARKIADEIKCSTQPIFRIYKNMSEMEKELFEMASDSFCEYYTNYPKGSVTPFADLGMVYITFARTYRFLFETLFLTDSRQGKSMYDLVNGSQRGFIIHEIRKMNDSSPEESSEIFMKMWIFIHGIACMVWSNDFDLPDSKIQQMMEETYGAFCKKNK